MIFRALLRLARLAPLPLVAALAHGCGSSPAASPPAGPPLLEGQIVLEDALPGSGIDFRLGHPEGRPLGTRDTIGHPAALLDADGDGRLDVLLAGPDRATLFRNRGGWKFAPVEDAGFRQRGYWQGVAVGDVDGDGRPDVYLSAFEGAGLYLNQGGGRFRDATPGSGLERALKGRWHTSAAFADVDQDGKPDLYVGAYLDLQGSDGLCEPLPGVKTACGPLDFPAQKGRLYRNLGGGKFQDVTRSSGLDAGHGRTLGVSFGDADRDGRPDLYLANDKMPGDLFLNRGGRRFVERGTEAGVAYGPEGTAQGGMGVDWGDHDGDGDLDLVVTTYQREPTSLYRWDAPALFTNVAYPSGIGAPTAGSVGWGVRWVDLDNDGDLDLPIANGHPLHRARELDPSTDYKQPFQVFRNDGQGVYEERPVVGHDLPRLIAGRALCSGDLDDDGRMDLLISDIEGQPLLLRNVSPTGHHWLTVALRSRDDAAGAVVTVRAGSRRWVRRSDPGGSYLSSSDPRVHFGLGRISRVDAVEVRWPGGTVTTLRDLQVDRVVTARS